MRARWNAGAVHGRLVAQREQLERGLFLVAKDARETVLSGRVQKFFCGQGIETIVNQYTLDGKPLSGALAGDGGDGGGGQPGRAGRANV